VKIVIIEFLRFSKAIFSKVQRFPEESWTKKVYLGLPLTKSVVRFVAFFLFWFLKHVCIFESGLGLGGIFENFLKIVCFEHFFELKWFSRTTLILYRQTDVFRRPKCMFSEIFIKIGQGQHSPSYHSLRFIHLITLYKFP
jgi:hypothetical protein